MLAWLVSSGAARLAPAARGTQADAATQADGRDGQHAGVAVQVTQHVDAGRARQPIPRQRAIERLGAKKDGVIRHHQLRRDGTVRDTVIYSMIAAEWPEARAQLLYLLARHNGA